MLRAAPPASPWRTHRTPDKRRAHSRDFHAQGRRQAQDQGNRRRGRGQPRRHRRVRDRDRHRLLRPHARPAGAPFAHRHHGEGQGRPAYRPPPHHRGRRHRARPGGEAGARRHEGHHPLCQRAHADGRGADARGDRHFGPAVSGVQGRVRARQGRHVRHRAGAGVVPGLRDECRHDAACRDAVRHQRPPYLRSRASRGWRARCAPRSRSIRARPARFRRPRERSAAEFVPRRERGGNPRTAGCTALPRTSLRCHPAGRDRERVHARLHRPRAAAPRQRRRHDRAHRALRVRARRLSFLGVPVRAVLAAAAPAVAGVHRLCAGRRRSHVRAAPARRSSGGSRLDRAC